VPDFLRERYNEGKFELYGKREDFNGTDEEYERQLPGQFMDKWVSELATTNLVRFIDEFNTPGAKLPQYINVQHCENVWRMQVRADALHGIWLRDYVHKYYEKVDDFYYWNRIPHKEQVDYVFYKQLYKLKPEWEHRMIKAGYKNSENKSFGKYFDIERAF
jgi:hypothetical protein